MYSREFVSKVHQELQLLLPTSTVLLGGSYHTNEATSLSDLDLYIIAPTFKMDDVRYLVGQFRNKYPDKKIRLMIVPQLAYYLGLYFCSGVTVSGDYKVSTFDRSISVVNALKLAMFYCILAREKGSEEMLKKAGHQAALALALAKTENHLPLSNRQLYKAIDKEAKFVIVKKIVAAKNAGQVIPSVVHVAEQLVQEILSLSEFCAPYAGFNWKQYLLFNLKFLFKGEWLFCFRNPDTMIINRLRRVLMQPETLQKHKAWLKRYVFPVIIY